MKPVQFCTGFIFCAVLHSSHILCSIAQFSHFVQFCTGFTFCAVLHRFHILCSFAQVSYFVQFCTGFVFCAVLAVVDLDAFKGGQSRETYKQFCPGFILYCKKRMSAHSLKS